MARISPRTRFLVLQRDAFRCTYCGLSAQDGARLEVDHVQPKAKGGADDVDNYVAACQDCNRGKSAEEVVVTEDSRSLPHPLAGRFFHKVDSDGYVRSQGCVLEYVGDGLILYQMADGFTGAPWPMRLGRVEYLVDCIFHNSAEEMREAWEQEDVPWPPDWLERKRMREWRKGA